MSDPDEKVRRRKRRIKNRSKVATDMIKTGEFKRRVVRDKHGKEHDLSKLTHRALIEAIQEKD